MGIVLSPGLLKHKEKEVTISEAIQVGVRKLETAGIVDARVDAEWLLAWVLGVRRMNLYLDLGKELENEQTERYGVLLARRAEREPLQHVMGTAEFCGREFEVSRDVLIPRPETEGLAMLAVEEVRRLMAERAGVGEERGPVRVLDYGTGSGCLAITVGLESREGDAFYAVASERARRRDVGCWVVALDVSSSALNMARRNAARLGLEEGREIRLVMGDGFGALEPDWAPFDVIVTNPPYIASGEIATLEPEVRDYDPRLALDGGPDGLDYYRELASRGGRWVSAGGVLLMEFGDGQEGAIAELFGEAGWRVGLPILDDTGRPRILVARCGVK